MDSSSDLYAVNHLLRTDVKGNCIWDLAAIWGSVVPHLGIKENLSVGGCQDIFCTLRVWRQHKSSSQVRQCLVYNGVIYTLYLFDENTAVVSMIYNVIFEVIQLDFLPCSQAYKYNTFIINYIHLYRTNLFMEKSSNEI